MPGGRGCGLIEKRYLSSIFQMPKHSFTFALQGVGKRGRRSVLWKRDDLFFPPLFLLSVRLSPRQRRERQSSFLARRGANHRGTHALLIADDRKLFRKLGKERGRAREQAFCRISLSSSTRRHFTFLFFPFLLLFCQT